MTRYERGCVAVKRSRSKNPSQDSNNDDDDDDDDYNDYYENDNYGIARCAIIKATLKRYYYKPGVANLRLLSLSDEIYKIKIYLLFCYYCEF
jgi:hypothetical protein